MKILAAVLYSGAFLAELWGVWLLVADILEDRKDLTGILGYSPKKQSPQLVRRYAGRAVEPLLGANLAEVEERARVLTGFVTDRMKKGFTSRWLGLVLVLVGSIIGLGANMVALFAPS